MFVFGRLDIGYSDCGHGTSAAASLAAYPVLDEPLFALPKAGRTDSGSACNPTGTLGCTG